MSHTKIVLLDVMDTLVTDPFREAMPRFFGMSLDELLQAKATEQKTGRPFDRSGLASAARSLARATATPVVASDFALYWAMLRELNLTAAHGHGSLLGSLR